MDTIFLNFYNNASILSSDNSVCFIQNFGNSNPFSLGTFFKKSEHPVDL